MAGFSDWRILGRQCAWAAALLLSLAAARRLEGDDERRLAVEQLRTRHGLVKVTARVFGPALENKLLARLRGLPALRERILTGERETGELIAGNELAWQQSAPAIARLKQQLAEASPTDPRRLLLADQLQRLQTRAVEPDKLAGHGPLRTRLIELAENRCTLTIDLAWIRRAASQLAERYEELVADAEVTRLIEQAGEACRLGPLRNYAAELRRLDEYERLASASHAPAYLQGGRLRVTAAVNDSSCITFTWSEKSDDVTFVPASLIEAAGIEIATEAPRETVRIAGHRVEARQIVLPSLRLASCVARNVPVYVLPPEAEHLGAQLTPLALSPCRARVEPAKARIVIEP